MKRLEGRWFRSVEDEGEGTFAGGEFWTGDCPDFDVLLSALVMAMVFSTVILYIIVAWDLNISDPCKTSKHQRRHCSVFGYHHAARHVSTTPIQGPVQAHRETPTETLDGWTSPNTNYEILDITAL